MILAQSRADAAEIRIVASPSLTTVFKEVGPRFERATGRTLALQYGLAAAQKQQMESGGFDVAIVPAGALDDAIKQGKVVAGSRTVVVRTGLGVGTRAGAAKPDLSSVDAFKAAMLDATSVTYTTDEPTGIQISKSFNRLGIAAQMKAKTKPAQTVARVWQAVAGGEAQFGFGFTSNVLSTPGVELAGPFPAELQYFVDITAGVGTTAKQTEAAKAFITYLLAPQSAAVMKAQGFDAPAP